MNEDQFIMTLRRIQYKHGHWLKWDEVADEVFKVWWEFERPDSHNRTVWGIGRSGPVLVNIADHDRESLVRTIFGMTLRLEEHECREFFTYGPERPFDPHKSLLGYRS